VKSETDWHESCKTFTVFKRMLGAEVFKLKIERLKAPGGCADMDGKHFFRAITPLMSAANALLAWAKGHSRERAFTVLVSGIALVSTCAAQQRAIDTAKSVLTVRVYKAGVFSAFGHDHEIVAPISSGSVDVNARRVELHVRAAALRVRDPNASQKDRDEIQKTMAGSEVLGVEQYPEIAFRSTSAESAGARAWTVHGELSMHGQSRPVTVEVREKDGHYVGASQFAQSGFGITPVKVAAGAVKVKDELRVEFDIQLVH